MNEKMEGLGQFASALGQQSPFNKSLDFGFSQLGNKLNNDRRESAFTDYGLPRYMAHMGGGSSIPQQKYQLAGNNFQSIGPVGARIPFGANQHMRRQGFGIEGPDPTQKSPPMIQPQSAEGQNFPQSSPQNDQPPPYELPLPDTMSKQAMIAHWWPNGPTPSPGLTEGSGPMRSNFSAPTPRQPR